MKKLTREELYELAQEALSERIEQLKNQKKRVKAFRQKQKQHMAASLDRKWKATPYKTGEQNVRKKNRTSTRD